MKNKNLGAKIKELRKRKGFSQEDLSEESGLSLRTIQRIENSETNPHGDSLIKLSNSLGVSPDEIIDWKIHENKGYLIGLNLSALSFLLFSIIGILVPLIMWISQKDKIRNVDKIGKEVLNFQITWAMALFLGYILNIVVMVLRIMNPEAIPGNFLMDNLFWSLILFGFLYLYNFVFIILNAFRIYKGKEVLYFPKIRFLKN